MHNTYRYCHPECDHRNPHGHRQCKHALILYEINYCHIVVGGTYEVKDCIIAEKVSQIMKDSLLYI